VLATLLSVVVGGVVAVALSFGGVAALTPSVDSPVPHSEMVKYGDNGHL
jgi:hypothetical protein